jgi:hypothetical protein
LKVVEKRPIPVCRRDAGGVDGQVINANVVEKPMRRKTCLPFLTALSLMIPLAGTHAQNGNSAQVPASGSGSPLAPSDLQYQATGDRVPRYFLVRQFFVLANNHYRESRDWHEYFLKELSLEPGTNAETAFIRALERAYTLEYGEDGPIVHEKEELLVVRGERVPSTTTMVYGRARGPSPEGKEEAAYRAELTAFEAQQAGALADVYFDLLQELSSLGVSADGIEKCIRDRVAPSTSVASDEPFDRADHPAKAFEAQLRKRTGE